MTVVNIGQKLSTKYDALNNWNWFSPGITPPKSMYPITVKQVNLKPLILYLSLLPLLGCGWPSTMYPGIISDAITI